MLKVNQLHFSYLEQPTLKNVNFSLAKGTTLAVIGESGCGKSTLLKLIYGLHDLNSGSIFWNNSEVLGPKYHLIPGMDYMKYLAQDFDLMPFITVSENVGKYLSNIDKKQKEKRVTELLNIVEMSEFADVKAKTLSGGQMQRVALARVLALEPVVLLLDEPFSHIDNFRKNGLRRKLFAYLKEKHITTLVATHDSAEALSFADEVLVMKNGELLCKNTPENLYQNPTDYYIASLFGDINQIITSDGKTQLLYPHQFAIVEKSSLEVTVANVFFRGNIFLIEAYYNDAKLYFENDSSLEIDSTIYLKITK